VGLVGGYLKSAGEVSATAYGVGSGSADVEGSTLTGEVYGGAEIPIGGSNFALTPQLGLRMANVSDVEADGQPIYALDGSPYSVDYSGVTMRLALRLRQ
jgi:hypothetical protein